MPVLACRPRVHKSPSAGRGHRVNLQAALAICTTAADDIAATSAVGGASCMLDTYSSPSDQIVSYGTADLLVQSDAGRSSSSIHRSPPYGIGPSLLVQRSTFQLMMNSTRQGGWRASLYGPHVLEAYDGARVFGTNVSHCERACSGAGTRTA